MKNGKLPNDILEKYVIAGADKINKNIIVGPQVGEDCSIIRMQDKYCVLTTDPITAADINSGRIGVNICCNDVASAGVRPFGILVTILAPSGTEVDRIRNVMEDIRKSCRELSIDILGGHTEITDGVNRMILSITAIGMGDSYVRTGGAQAGDDIVVTGYAGLEGTAIISRDYFNQLKGMVDEEILLKGQEMLKDISVVKTGLIAAKHGVNSMHDATEGGILGAIWEVADTSEKGVYIYKERIPIAHETIDICNAAGADPYRLISSGCMIITCRDGEGLCRLLESEGINASVVGKITEGNKIVKAGDIEYEIAAPEADEIYSIIERLG
jgi:hydrogenase maturation factor